MLRHSTLIIWTHMKANLYEYIMKTNQSLRNHYKLEKDCGKIRPIYLQSYSYLIL